MKQRASLLLESDDSGDDQVELRINRNFAARLEHNKRREELHRLKEKHPEVAARLALKEASQAADKLTDSEDESSGSTTDEEVDVLLACLATDITGLPYEDEDEHFDTKFLGVLAKLKKRDSDIYKEDKIFFDDNEVLAGQVAKQNGHAAEAKQRPVLLKDIIARQALEGAAVVSSGDEEDGRSPQEESAPYVREQESLRQAFLQAAESAEAGGGQDDEFGGMMTKQKRKRAIESAAVVDEEQEDVQKLLDNYFGKDESQLPSDDLFLRRYIAGQGRAGIDTDGELLLQDADDEEDAQHLEAAEVFEARYNFRFEEPASANVTTYPRQIEGLARKPDSKRAVARQRKADRRAEEKERRAAEVRRLKTLKRREIEDRLQQLRDQVGSVPCHEALADLLASEDFDDAEYDAAMQRAFGEDFYQEEDAGDLEGMEGEDEAESSGDDGGEPASGGFTAAKQRSRDVRANASGSERSDAMVQRLLEEYYKLDYEDNIAGMPTHFHYKQVPQADFGLTTKDILALPDKDLNQIVGLAKIAPYREDSIRPNYGKMKELDVGPLARKARQKMRSTRQKDNRKAHKGDGLGLPRDNQPQLSQSHTAPAAAVNASAQKISIATQIAARDVGGSSSSPMEEAVPPSSAGGEAKRSRLASFEKPTLHKEASKHKKRKILTEDTQGQASGLTKAQKKNLRRSRKRADVRSTE